jgi:hypothetical protein
LYFPTMLRETSARIPRKVVHSFDSIAGIFARQLAISSVCYQLPLFCVCFIGWRS